MSFAATVGQQRQITEALTVMQCGACFCIYAIPQSMELERQRDGRTWHCPNGHQQHYGDTENARLKREAEKQYKLRVQSEASHDQTKARLREKMERLEEEKRKVSAQKAAKTRLKNRIASGVCPCCERHFVDLHAHMDNKHPEFKASH